MMQSSIPEDPRRQRAILALAAGKSVTDAAEAAGVNRWTVHEWKKDPTFREALSTLREETWDEARELVSAGLLESVRLLVSMVRDDALAPGERMSAAGLLLRSGAAVSESRARIAEMAARLSDLEARSEALIRAANLQALRVADQESIHELENGPKRERERQQAERLARWEQDRIREEDQRLEGLDPERAE